MSSHQNEYDQARQHKHVLGQEHRQERIKLDSRRAEQKECVFKGLRQLSNWPLLLNDFQLMVYIEFFAMRRHQMQRPAGRESFRRLREAFTKPWRVEGNDDARNIVKNVVNLIDGSMS